MSRPWSLLVVLIISSVAVVAFVGCDGDSSDTTHPPPVVDNQPKSDTTTLPIYDYVVVSRLPHDPEAFTQGLEYHDGVFYESTGQVGQSSLRKVEPGTGTVTERTEVPAPHFAEGLTVVGDTIYQITWQTATCFLYDRESLRRIGEFTYTGEGWGLARISDSLLAMSDGTNQIRLINPRDFSIVRSIFVTAEGRALEHLNELEYVDGELFANIWQSDLIARIDPNTGNVTGFIDARGLLDASQRSQTDVLNGIAWDADSRRLFLTGKYWPTVFEVRLVKRETTASLQ